MANVRKSAASLRIFGDELIPEDVSASLGSKPSSSYRKGEVQTLRGGSEVTRKRGMWLLEAKDREPENLDEQVQDLLSRLTQQPDVWENLSRRFEIDLYCGLFMDEANEGLSLSHATLRALADRHIEIGLDIYAPIREVAGDEPCPCGSGKLCGECCAIKRPA